MLSKINVDDSEMEEKVVEERSRGGSERCAFPLLGALISLNFGGPQLLIGRN